MDKLIGTKYLELKEFTKEKPNEELHLLNQRTDK